MELKNIDKNLRTAYDGNLSDYKDTIPHLFNHNAFVVLSNGDTAKIGSITSKYEHFHEWKRLAEEDIGAVDTETLLKGLCAKANFMDLFENFIYLMTARETLSRSSPKIINILGLTKPLKR